MNAYKIFTIESGSVSVGATIEKLHLKGASIDIPAILIGEEGRGRERGVLPVGNPPMVPCPERFDQYIGGPRSEAAFQGNDPGPKPEKIPVCSSCGESYSPWELYSFNEGKGGWKSSHPAEKGLVVEKLLFAEVGETKAGKPKLFAKSVAESDEKAIVVFRTQIGFRGGNSHTGDRNGKEEYEEWGEKKTRIIYAEFPGEIIVKGYIAEGIAGRMGGGAQLVALMPKDVIFRTGYSGRLYGEPAAHYYVYNGEKIFSATWKERTAADLF